MIGQHAKIALDRGQGMPPTPAAPAHNLAAEVATVTKSRQRVTGSARRVSVQA